MTFHPGQKVICLYDTDASRHITKGETYTVKCVTPLFKLLQLEGVRGGLWFTISRFDPVYGKIPSLEDML